MRTPWLYLALSFAALCSLGLTLQRHAAQADREQVVVHCASGLLHPMRELSDTTPGNLKLSINYGPSGVLLNQTRLTGGDLFLPADASYLDGLPTIERIELATLHVVAVVPRGNPQNIRQLTDLLRPELRLCLPEPSAAIGRFVREHLQTGPTPELWPALEHHAAVHQPNVNAVVQAVALGAADVALAWDAVARATPEVDLVPLPHFATAPSRVVCAVLPGAHPAARNFARHLASPAGRAAFARHHFAAP